MIERFDGGTSEAKNMIDIQFQQASNQDKTSKRLLSFIGKTVSKILRPRAVLNNEMVQYIHAP